MTSSPRKARRPVSASYSTQPNAHMSARRSTARPRACSGDMYAAVPRIMPTPVIATGEVSVGDAVGSGSPGESGSPAEKEPPAPPVPPESPDHAALPTAFASPKSSTLTVPSSATLMFAGFRSR